jgi:acyl carrier protein
MTIKEKLSLLEELLDIERDTLREETLLEDLDEWDSMAVITLIAMFDDEFGKVVTAKQMKAFESIKDIIGEME